MNSVALGASGERPGGTADSASTRRFLVLVFAFGFACQLAAVWLGVEGRGRWLLQLTMWAPAISALLASGGTRRMAWTALKKVGWRRWPLALGIGWSYILLQDLLALASGRAAWNQENFPLAADGNGIAGIHGLATMLGFGSQSFAFLGLNLLVTLSVATLLLAISGGIGEELGWRAVLQPLFERRFGRLKGTFLVGVTWAYWHVPANLAGYNDSRHPIVVTLLLYPIFVVSFAFALAWLYHVSGGAVWTVAIAHAANNVISSAFVMKPVGWGSEMACATVAAVLLGGFFAWRLSRSGKDLSTTQSEALR
jgi:CAAX protease family protein